MDEVAERVKLQDLDSAKKWCIENDVPVKKIGKNNLVIQFELEIVLAKPLVTRLQKKHPQHWETLLSCVLPCNAVRNYFLTIFNEPRKDKVSGRVQAKNNEEKNLLKALLQ